MYGVCYGPFNLRNEIDRHNSTVGGHGSNTHFVTGDGGFINAFVSGFGGLMLGASQTEDAIRLSRPTVPERTLGLRFNGLRFRGRDLDYEVGPTTLTFTVNSGGPVCVTASGGQSRVRVVAGEGPKVVDVAAFAFPGTIGEC